MAERQRIWQVCIPHEAPLDTGIDLDELARMFPLPGANISNIVLAAAFLAAAEEAPIGLAHLLAATRREYLKMGKIMPQAGFAGEQEVPQ